MTDAEKRTEVPANGNRPRLWSAIVLHADDNVATVLVALAPGETARIEGRETVAPVAEPIPLGHKFALEDIPAGAIVRKYGQPIAVALVPIARGTHVHLHNARGLSAKAEKVSQ